MNFQSQSHEQSEVEAKQRHLISQNMTSAQKSEFLEKYACLILLNYTHVLELDTLFLQTANDLKQDIQPSIREQAVMVGKLFEMYRDVEKR
ncbi:MAG: hypothetical protein ABIJ04_10640 [Bacteroidota bacterium]